MMGATGPWWWRNDIFFLVAFEWRARCGRNPSSSPRPAGMSGDCLRGSLRPTALTSACSSVAWSRFRFPCWFLRPRVYENQRGLTNRNDGRQDHHWSGLMGPEDWAVLVRHASTVSCGRSRGWNWCRWKTDFRRRPVAAAIGPWRAAGGTR